MSAPKSFSNIKNPTAPAQRKVRKLVKKVSTIYRSRYLAHASVLAVAALLVIGNSPDQAHSVSVRLMSSQAGIGSTLDASATAAIAADIADKSQLIVEQEATKTATVKSSQIALLTADDTALAKRQVVSTAGNATRDISTYVVGHGDTLSGVASKFGITTSTLKWANDLDDADMLKPGQSLTILPVSGLVHIVTASDTPDHLAEIYGSNAAQILSFNNAEVKGLTAGTKVIIPDGIKPEAPKPALATSRVAGASTTRGTPASAPTLTRYAFSGNGYSYGYCTYYVGMRRGVPSNWGNAVSWYYNAQASGFGVGYNPVPGAIAWTGAGYYGHVAYVESVSGGMVTVSEMNYNGGWNRVTSRTVPAGTFRYIY